MKRRVFGFLLGAGLGLAGAYLFRRLRNNQAVQEQVLAPPSPAKPVVTAEIVEPERSKVKFNVRSSGPRPQNTADIEARELMNGLSAARSIEPAAATETDVTATSPRSEMFEAALPLPQPEPVASLVDTETAEGQSAETVFEEADLLRIIGIGPVYKGRLQEQGIHNFTDLLALSPTEISQKTGIPQERIEREKWHEQATEFSRAIEARKTGEIEPNTSVSTETEGNSK